MCKMRRNLDLETLIILYHTFVFPYLVYCCEIWGNTVAIHLDPLTSTFNFTFFI